MNEKDKLFAAHYGGELQKVSRILPVKLRIEETELMILQATIFSNTEERPVDDVYQDLVKEIAEYSKHFYNAGHDDALFKARQISLDRDKTTLIAIRLLDILAIMGIRGGLRNILSPLFRVAPDLINRMQKCYKDRNGPKVSNGGLEDDSTSGQTSAS